MFITTVLLFCYVLLLAQERDAKSIFWSKNRKLTWTDFEYIGNNSTLIGENAIITPQFKVNISGIDTLIGKVVVELYREGSVTIDTLSADLLQHEQLHFDIAECFARKMRHRFAELFNIGCNDINVFRQIKDSIYNEYILFQNQYDRETGHSVLRTQQALWNKKVEVMLDNLNEYELPEPCSK